MGFGKGTNYSTTTATQTLPSYLTNAYQGLVGSAGGLASQPANWTPDQSTAFQNIGSLAGSSNPAFSSASGALSNSMTPTSQTVGSYMSPYMSNVIDALKANMQETNAQQQQSVIGNAATKGALGGNRVGVAQGELARQQALANNQTLADTLNQGYGTALGAAQADKQAMLSAAGQYTGLGQTQMQTGLDQAGAQLAAGTQQQQFPYQQQQWLASILSGLGGTAGGTTTQQKPEGNIFSQMLGAGLGVASLFRDGGRVQHAASGGVMGGSFSPFANDNGIGAANDNFGAFAFAPAMTGTHGNFPTIEDMSAQDSNPLSQYSGVMKEGAGNIKDWMTPRPALHAGYNLANGGVVPEAYFRGGRAGSDNIIDRRSENSFVHTDHVGLPTDHFSRHGYASGGRPTADDVAAMYSGIFDPGQPLPRLVKGPPPGPVIDGVNPIDGDRLGLGMGNTSSEPPMMSAYADTPDDMGMNQPPAGLRAVPMSEPGPSDVVPYTTGDQFVTKPAPGYSENIGDAFHSLTSGKGLNLSPDMRQALLAAGMGMMASKSPFALSGIGEGGMAGIGTWNERQKLEKDLSAQRAANALSGGQLALTAQQSGLTGAEAGRTRQQIVLDRYDFTPTMAGMLVTNKLAPADSQVIPYSSLKGWARGKGVDVSQLPNGGQQPAVAHQTEEGTRFDVQPPSDVSPSGMAWTPTGQAIIQGQTSDALTQARQSSTIAQDATLQLTAMKEAAKNLPSSGALAPGQWAEARGGIAKSLNTLASMANMKLPFDPATVGSIEEMNKLTTQFGFNLARTTGSDVASTVISQGITAVPNIENTPQGFRSITSLIQAGLNRTRDYYDFLNRWADKTGGDLTGAAEYFNQVAPPSAYSQSAILSSAIVPKKQADIDNAPAGTLFNIGGQLMVK